MDIKYEVKTNKSFEEAISSIESALQKRGFGVLWRLNFKDKLKEKNLDFEPNFMILEVCNPKQAQEILIKHLDVGYFLPCKMVVYEDEQEIKMGFIKPSYLIGLLDYQDANSIGLEVENVMKEALEEAK